MTNAPRRTEPPDTQAQAPEGDGEASTEAATEAKQPLTLSDGVYHAAYDAPDANGWQAFMELTIAEGKIQSVVFDERSAQDELNLENDAVVDQLTKSLIAVQDPAFVEPVKESSELSQTFMMMATALFEQATAGNEEVLIITQPNP